MTALEILDPTAGTQAPSWPLSARHAGAGHVGLLDISKPQGDLFLDTLEQHFTTRGHRVSRFHKPTMTRPATAEVVAEMAERCDVALVALAD